MWDAATGREELRIEAESVTCSISSDGSRITASTGDGVRIWDAANGRVLATMVLGETLATTKVFFGDPAISPDGRWVALARRTTVKLWDAKSGRELCEYRLAATEGVTQFGFMTWVPDSRSVMVVCDDGSIHKLTLENLACGPPIVTAWRHTSRPRWWRRNPPLRYGIGCPLCRVWSKIPAWAIGNEISCPHCQEPLLLNFFVIDGDWRAVAKAWGDTDEARQRRQVEAELEAEMRALEEKLGRLGHDG
jgi:hypothetical protein